MIIFPVQQISLPANIRLVEEDWKVEHLLDPREHEGEVGVPVDQSHGMLTQPRQQTSQKNIFHIQVIGFTS